MSLNCYNPMRSLRAKKEGNMRFTRFNVLSLTVQLQHHPRKYYLDILPQVSESRSILSPEYNYESYGRILKHKTIIKFSQTCSLLEISHTRCTFLSPTFKPESKSFTEHCIVGIIKGAFSFSRKCNFWYRCQ